MRGAPCASLSFFGATNSPLHRDLIGMPVQNLADQFGDSAPETLAVMFPHALMRFRAAIHDLRGSFAELLDSCTRRGKEIGVFVHTQVWSPHFAAALTFVKGAAKESDRLLLCLTKGQSRRKDRLPVE